MGRPINLYCHQSKPKRKRVDPRPASVVFAGIDQVNNSCMVSNVVNDPVWSGENLSRDLAHFQRDLVDVGAPSWPIKGTSFGHKNSLEKLSSKAYISVQKLCSYLFRPSEFIPFHSHYILLLSPSTTKVKNPPPPTSSLYLLSLFAYVNILLQVELRRRQFQVVRLTIFTGILRRRHQLFDKLDPVALGLSQIQPDPHQP